MKLIFLGPPASGKGTYAQRVGPKIGVPQISTGELIREEIKKETEHGKEAKPYVEAGQLIPDNIVIELLQDRIAQPDAEKGFILDGYPRNIVQADALEGMASIDKIINLVVPDEVVIYRLSGRRSCKKCGKIYNVNTLPPKQEGVCDDCGGELYHRADDTIEVLKDRLKVYREKTEPLIDYYKKKGIVADIECNQADIPPEIVVEKIMNALE